MATLHIPGGPAGGYPLREGVDANRLYELLNSGDGRVEVLVNNDHHMAQSVVVWADRIAWFSIQ